MKFKISSKYFIGILVALFFGIALYLRVFVPYNQVFDSGWIKFTSVDAYYHMRLVDTIVHNFPHVIGFDPFFAFPGSYVSGILFFNQLLAAVIRVIGLGSPTPHTADVVAAYFPAVLGALNVIPVYFIGKVLFGRWAGVFAAGLMAILPGEFLGRSVLGFTDYHVVESVFTTVTMLFLILAIKAARQGEFTFHHLYQRNWSVMVRPVIYSLLAGIFLGLYILTWGAALLFVFLIFVYWIVQGIIDHLRGKSLDYLCIVNLFLFVVVFLVVYTVHQPGINFWVPIAIALLTPFVMSGLSRLLNAKKVRPAYYPLVLVGVGVLGLAVFYLLQPKLLKNLLGYFSLLMPTGGMRTISEVTPLLFPGGNFSFSTVWTEYTTTFFISLVTLGILAYMTVRQNSAEKSLFVVWSLLMLALNLAQRRFGYYFAVNVALLTGYLSWRVLELVGFKESAGEVRETPTRIERGKVRPKPSRGRSSQVGSSPAVMFMSVVVLFFVVFFPNFNMALANAKAPHFAPSDAWYETLSWLKESTPDPFGNPEFYYEFYQIQPSGEDYNRPESAYGVMAWWDYGYWIMRIAHRIPNVNPSQYPEEAVSKVASFFTTEDENLAKEIVREMGSKYIIIDYPTVGGKFWALAEWADRREDEFYEVYYYREGNKLTPACLYYPEYYRTLSVRLYNFNGKTVATPKPLVISYEERTSSEGERYKELISARAFNDYQDALNYVASQKSGNYKIVSGNPFISPIPL